MDKLSKDFIGKEVLIYGVEKKDAGFYKTMYKNFTANGITVYGLPTTPATDLGFETYPDLASLPHMPKCVVLLCPDRDRKRCVKELKRAGMSRLILYKKRYATDPLLAYCKQHSVQVRTGCPMLLYGSGVCAMHAALSGYGKERKK